MIETGRYNELTIIRETSIGLYLIDDDDRKILLPNESCPEKFNIEDVLEVFVYRNAEGNQVATTVEPKIFLYEFAFLTVSSVEESGAWMDWGLGDDKLFVPTEEQAQGMKAGSRYLVFLDLDQEKDELFGSCMVELYLQNEDLSCKEGDKVDVMVFRKTDLGFSVIVNNEHEGLIYNNEIFSELEIGDQLTGYLKKIRDENKLDVSLQAQGYRNFNNDNCGLILKKLNENEGALPLNDKSSPDDISIQLGLSKKAFKQAIGALYKERRITIEKDGIKLVK